MTSDQIEERRLREVLREMGDARADASFRLRLKQQFVTGDFPRERERRQPPPVDWRRRWGWALVPAAAAIALILLIPDRAPSWKLHDVRGEGALVIDGRTAAAGDPTVLPRSIEPGVSVETAEGITLDLAIDGTLLFELAHGASVDLPEAPRWRSETPLIARLHVGELRVMTGPRFSGERLRILTAEGRTELVGTTVSVYKESGVTCVCVLEGEARIGVDEGDMQPVPSGQRKIMYGDGRPSRVTTLEPHHAEGLEEFLERHGEIFGGG